MQAFGRLKTILVFAAAIRVCGQETTGALNGTVFDAAGLPIPQANVTVSGLKLVRPVEVHANAAGAYAFASLPPGTYSLRCSVEGFQTATQDSIELQVGKQLRFDFHLQVGSAVETVTVESAGASVDVQTSSQNTNATAAFTDRLPKDRSFDSMISLAPGARPEPKGGGFQVDGASGAENIFVIDGVDNTNLQVGTLPRNSQLPVEQIEEVQVKSGVMDAQYGGGTGGVVNAIIRSGSNAFHGQGSLYTEWSGLNAGPRRILEIDPVDDNRAKYVQPAKDAYRLLNPGLSIGGPIQRDKLWFFASWYPEFRQSERKVGFLTGDSGRYSSANRTDFLVMKLDYAPTGKVRTFFSYVYSPDRVHGMLPSVLGTDSPNSPWADRGNRSAASSYNFGVDVALRPNLLLTTRGGYSYRNYNSQYGVTNRTYYAYVDSTSELPLSLAVPAAIQGAAGDLTSNNQVTARDQQTRFNLTQNASWTWRGMGQHTVTAGWQWNRLHNDVEGNYWPAGNIKVFWNLAYPALTREGQFRGLYGYYIDRQMVTSGVITGNNHALYVQDAWRIGRLTVNAGVRAEREVVPSFSQPGLADNIAITFPFLRKVAPRVGAAYDVTGNGKLKAYAAFGLFYDLMKYEASRVSFGGEKWIDFVYPLDNANILAIHPQTSPRPNLIESYNFRIPANDPANNRIDPNILPTRERKYDVGLEYLLTPHLSLSARYTRQRMDRTIENVGVIGATGTDYYVANPGQGLAASAGVYPEGVLPPPRPHRDYDAVDVTLSRRMGAGFQFFLSYTWSRLHGDYSGLASSDENGRAAPNSTRYYDNPWMSVDQRGRFVEGPLATDRPQTFKVFATYLRKNRLGSFNVAPRFSAFSGTPLSTQLGVLGDPMFPLGRNDLGRTPVYSNLDLMVFQEFRGRGWGEGRRLRVEVNVTNVFNQATATNYETRYNHPNDGDVQFSPISAIYRGFDYRQVVAAQGLRENVVYGLPNAFQNPRSIRLGLHFFF